MKCRGLTGAVAAEQSYHLVAVNVQRYVEKNMAIAIVAVNSLDFEKSIHAAAMPPR
jgi:hypothetical protein